MVSRRHTYNHNGQYRWSRSETACTTQCGRCAVFFSPYHFCKALNRKCRTCFNYGHYDGSSFCPKTYIKLSTVSAEMMSTTDKSKQAAPKQQKSKAKKVRDYQRLLSFRQRKSICASMPFCDIPNSELSELMPTPQCELKTLYNELIEDHIVAVNYILKLEGQNKSLENSMATTRSCLSDEQQKRRKAEQEVHKLKEEMKHGHSIHDAASKTICDLQQQNLNLRKELQNLRELNLSFGKSISELREQNLSLETKIKDLNSYKDSLENVNEEIRIENKKMYDDCNDYQRMTQQMIDKCRALKEEYGYLTVENSRLKEQNRQKQSSTYRNRRRRGQQF